MLVTDARDMIARNVQELGALRQIAARMAAEGKALDISRHEAIIAGQQDPSKFGPVFYYDGARDAEMPEQLSHVRVVFRNQVSAIRSRALRQFEDDSAKTIARLFPSKKQQEESR